jgi:4a-hydroxytetrahydrobiopterin dehydratase
MTMSNVPLLTEDEQKKSLAKLNADALEPWEIVENRIHRRYEFKSFNDAFGFMTQSAMECEVLSHHPRWVNVWNVVEIGLYTHRAGGLTHLDFDLAGRMEPIAKKLLA